MGPGSRSLHSLGRDDGNKNAHHDRNKRVYCVSCRMLAISARKVVLPRSSSEAAIERLAVTDTTSSSSASTRWLSVCPNGTRRAAAEIQFDATAWRKA